MVRKIDFRFGLLCLIVLSLMITVSCAKKAPDSTTGTDQSATMGTADDQQMTGTDSQQDMTEEDIQAQKRAQMAKEAEAEREKAAAKHRFLTESVYFGFDDATLTKVAREKLRFKAQWLRSHPDACIIVEGHCDERGTDEYNLALGSRRAESVKDFLVKAGIGSSRLTTISYGEERPAVDGHNEAAWAKNRRAEFKFCN